MTHVMNGVGHFDIAGPDATKLQEFYAQAFHWAITPRGPGYALIETPLGSPNGAIVEAETTSLTIGIVVPNLEDLIGRISELSGKVVMPITDNGWVKKAQIADPAGNILTVIQG
jgi:predicted enzyme related to lactoylglutathione lyase